MFNITMTIPDKPLHPTVESDDIFKRWFHTYLITNNWVELTAGIYKKRNFKLSFWLPRKRVVLLGVVLQDKTFWVINNVDIEDLINNNSYYIDLLQAHIFDLVL